MADSRPADGATGSPAGTSYAERLWPGPLGWLLVVVFGVLLGIALLPVNDTLALVVAVLGVAGGVLVAVLTTPRVEVSRGILRAGAARIPARLVGPAAALEGEALRTELGPALDARAYLCLRGWVHRAVRIELHDPQDPTPYWVVSTRRPDRLVAALEAAGARTSTPTGA
ncbi:DUF3093 domain-containing protein [Cellulomonas sp. SG140]|uniref:DUF3093 domain-containing protein n=1 Tax=Cellulomonas sp. SG140 TaxID=2976536 RepID=UPI0021E8AC48|nr:DUF3093 domain-containing protein [Cellulomonas sp. SG140]